MSDKLKIWAEIKKQAPVIIKAGGNPVDLLLWSQGKTFGNLLIIQCIYKSVFNPNCVGP